MKNISCKKLITILKRSRASILKKRIELWKLEISKFINIEMSKVIEKEN